MNSTRQSKRLWRTVAPLLASLCVGCSVYKVASAPPAKDLSVLTVGAPRRQVIAELGEPQISAIRSNGGREDSWDIAQGRPVLWKIAAASYMLAIDVSTLGFWEIREHFGPPAKRVLDEDLWFTKGRRLIVTFGPNDTVDSVVRLAAPLPGNTPASMADGATERTATSSSADSSGS